MSTPVAYYNLPTKVSVSTLDALPVGQLPFPAHCSGGLRGCLKNQIITPIAYLQIALHNQSNCFHAFPEGRALLPIQCGCGLSDCLKNQFATPDASIPRQKSVFQLSTHSLWAEYYSQHTVAAG